MSKSGSIPDIKLTRGVISLLVNGNLPREKAMQLKILSVGKAISVKIGSELLFVVLWFCSLTYSA
jgi:hypothetical protein